MIAAENLTACEGYESTRRAGANNVILLPENINQEHSLCILRIFFYFGIKTKTNCNADYSIWYTGRLMYLLSTE